MIRCEANGKPLQNSASAYIEYHTRFGNDVTKDLPKPRLNAKGEVESDPIPISTLLKLYEVFRIAAEPELRSKPIYGIMDEEIDTANAEVMAEVSNAVLRLLSERSSQKN